MRHPGPRCFQGCGDAQGAIGHGIILHGFEFDGALPARHAHLDAGRQAGERAAFSARRAASRPARPAAARNGAPWRRCDRSARRPRAPGRPGPGPPGWALMALDRRFSTPPASTVSRTDSEVSSSKPARCRTLPSTRRTFQPGRSGERRDRALEALRQALGVDVGARGFGERRHGQHDIGQSAAAERYGVRGELRAARGHGLAPPSASSNGSACSTT